MNEKLAEKLKTLPHSPGVYFHKNLAGEIIYVGKAAVLRNRVRHYFRKQKDIDIKTKALVAEIYDTDWVETESEIDALFLEAEMVKRYMPQYNILLRDDKSLTFVRIDMKNEWPHVSFTRNPLDDGAEYYGPYYNAFAVKKALRYLRRIFPYYVKKPNDNERPDLYAHLGLSPINMTSNEYKVNLRKLIRYIEGDGKKIVADIESEMKEAALDLNFEKAAKLRNRLHSLKELKRQIMFGDKEFLDISKDKALVDLTELLGLKKIPARIEGFDISHLGGTNVVASMVVFSNGASNRSEYRKFKTRIDKNDDFYNMNETLMRRLSEKNLKTWGVPDLILIDGGKGQLDVALKARNECGQIKIPFIGLAKRDEQIISADHSINRLKLAELGGWAEESDKFVVINLPKNTHIIKLLQRIRDESHRFAVSYHTTLKVARQKQSVLDEIPGVGAKTKAKLIKKFGSVNGIKNASIDELNMVVGIKIAKLVSEILSHNT